MSAHDKANKHLLVASVSNGRTESLKDITPAETQALIKHLEKSAKPKKDPSDVMRKKIISIAWQMNWTKKNKSGKLGADISRINNWCNKFGYLHKDLNDYKYKELPKLLTQFQSMYKDYLKHI